MNKRILLYAVTFISLAIVIHFFHLNDGEEENFSKKVKIALRQAGNQLLLSNQDSTSLILPVKKLSKHQFELSFQSDLLFLPDSLVAIVKRNVESIHFSKSYLVEVIRCADDEVAYSYEINADEEKTIVPCSNRVLPINCYTIEFQFLERSNSLNLWFLLPILFLGLFLIEYSIYKKRNGQKEEEKAPGFIPLGTFRFYPHQNKLIKEEEEEEIALSRKECELLEIFAAKLNQVLKREDLMKRVWEDNGVFVGRSLDTYVSKLRKKLQNDDSIKIINAHGIGYKLEIKESS